MFVSNEAVVESETEKVWELVSGGDVGAGVVTSVLFNHKTKEFRSFEGRSVRHRVGSNIN